MSRYRQTADDVNVAGMGAGLGAVWAVVVLTILIVGVGLVVGLTRPTFLGFQREAMQQSGQYVEAKQNLLLGLVDDHAALVSAAGQAAEGSQQRADLESQMAAKADRIRSEAELLPPSEVPDSVRTFIASQEPN